MTHRSILSLLLAISFLVTGCRSYTSYRPLANTVQANKVASVCIAECRSSTQSQEAYYACLDQCSALSQEDGGCDGDQQVCEQRKQLSPAKVFLGVLAATVVIVATIGVVETVSDADDAFSCDLGDPGC